jgi:CRP-like cAMP-binding protein
MITSSDSQKKSKRPSFKRETYRTNEAIFDKGDKGDCAYLIKEGRAEIRMGSHGSNPQVIVVLKKDDILGEMTLLDDRPRMAAAIAREPAKVVAISKKRIFRRFHRT